MYVAIGTIIIAIILGMGFLVLEMICNEQESLICRFFDKLKNNKNENV